MNVLIIEDEYPAAERLIQLLNQLERQINVLEVLDSVSGATTWLDQNQNPDLIFSDIQLSDGLSFQIFENLPLTSSIIFTTSYDEYAIKAFKLKSIDYLLKPIKIQELNAAVSKFYEIQNLYSKDHFVQKMESLLEILPITGKRYKNRFLVKVNEQFLPIAKEEIAYFYSTNGLLCLVRRDGKKFIIDYTLEELEKLLDPSFFFRLNRQFIATLKSVVNINTYFNGKLKIILHPEIGQDVVVSREKVNLFKEWIEIN